MPPSPSPAVSRASSLRPSTSPGSIPQTPPPLPPAIPPWIVPTEQVAADPDAPLGENRRGGHVFRGTWNNSVVAVKIMSKDTSADGLLDLVEVWERIRHPHILRVFGASPPDADPLFIVTQYHANGNANQYLAKHPKADRSKILFQVAVGMQYLHGLGLLHGSIKPTNILITEKHQAAIADCSMIEITPSGHPSAHRYFSPEAWKGTVSRPSDVFAFAMTAFEVFTGTPPWGVLSESQIYQLICREDSRPDRPDHELEERVGLTDDIWGVMTEAWYKESRLRPSFEHIIKMWPATGDNPILDSSDHPEDSPDSDQHSPAISNEMTSLQLWRTSHAYSNSMANGPPAYDVPSAVRGVPKPTLPTATFQPQSQSSPAIPQFSPPRAPRSLVRGLSESAVRSLSLPKNSTDPQYPPNERRFKPIVRSSTRYADDILRNYTPPPSAAGTSGHELPTSSRGTLYEFRSAPQSPMTMSFWPSSRPATSHAALSGGTSWDPPTLPSVHVSPLSAQFSGITSIDETRAVPYNDTTRSQSSTVVNDASSSGVASGHSFELHEQFYAPNRVSADSDRQSVTSGTQQGSSVRGGRVNSVLLAGALHSEATEGRKSYVIDKHLTKVILIAAASNKEAQKLVTAGTVPTLIILLRARAVDSSGLEAVLIALGLLAHDPISANIIYRTNTAATLIEIFKASLSLDIGALAIWCLNRICRSNEVAAGLIKLDLAGVLMKKGLVGVNSTSRQSAWCLGSLVQTDAFADTLAVHGLVQAAADHLRIVSDSGTATPEDICAAVYLVARISRSIKLSKSLAREGCVSLVARHLNQSSDPQVLQWSARAVGCMMRPNSSDMSKSLLDAGCAKGLARLPRVLPTEEVEPLASFAFAIQRFSCAEWGGGTRKALVQAGVVDSLLAALRTASEVPYPQVHIELALAVSHLGDVGGAAIRKEIINAGGIDILKRVANEGKPEVAKACNMAITSITGNLWTRNAASAKTAMAHNWNGGCPDYQPGCPLPLPEEE